MSKIIMLVVVIAVAVFAYSLNPISSAPPGMAAAAAQSIPWEKYIAAIGAIVVGLFLVNKFNANAIITTVALSLIVGGFAFFIPVALLKFG